MTALYVATVLLLVAIAGVGFVLWAFGDGRVTGYAARQNSTLARIVRQWRKPERKPERTVA